MGARLMLRFMVFAAVVAMFPAFAAAQARYEVLDQAGKIVGLFEYTYVLRPEGNFASSQFFKGAKALESRKGMKPVLRSHVQMGADMCFEKYTRWETSGIDTTEFKVFKFKKDIKMRVARGENGKVSVLGKIQPVFVIEPDQPHLSYFVIDPSRAEYKIACINTKLEKIGQATVTFCGQVENETVLPPAPVALVEPAGPPELAIAPTVPPPPAPADDQAVQPEAPVVKIYRYSIDGDCGKLTVWYDNLGNMVKSQSDTRVYNLIP